MTVDDLGTNGRREFLKKMAMAGAFVIPGVASYAMNASADPSTAAPATGASNGASSDPSGASNSSSAAPSSGGSNASSGASNSSSGASNVTTTTVAPTTTTIAPTTTTTVPEEVVEEEDVDLTSTALPSTK